MREIFREMQSWLDKGEPFALATVIKTWGSAPRPIGSVLAASHSMDMLGSVSGGCVEGAVLKEAVKTIKSGESTWLGYGVTDEDAWTLGLSCGGKIEVFVETFVAFSPAPEEQAAWQGLRSALDKNQGCVWVTQLKGKQSLHHVYFPDRQGMGSLPGEHISEMADKAYRERKNQLVEHGDQAYFIQVFPRKSQLLIVGAAHVTVDLVDLAKQFDFETIVVDPRGIFANKTQFRNPPDQLFVAWPAEVFDQFTFDPYTYAVMLTHDPKIDDQALHLLLKSEVAYIGALGSTRTHKKRVARLEEAGFSTEDIARIHAPIGVDIHAKRPKEIALSILSELIKVKNQFV